MWRRLLASILVPAAVLALVSPAQAADPPEPLRLAATLDGRDLADIDANRPLRLTPDSALVVALTVTNSGDREISVPRVRFNGEVIGLAFFSFTAQVGLVVAPGATVRSTFEVTLDDLGSQAVGLLPGRLVLLAKDGAELAGSEVTVDVRGATRSVYGLFGLGVGLLTLTMLGGLLFRLATRRLPVSRWSRAWRFAFPGCGLGLALTVTLSVFRVAVPSDGLSLQLVAAGAVVGFVFGYLTPSQLDDGDPEAVYDEDVRPAGLSILDAPRHAR